MTTEDKIKAVLAEDKARKVPKLQVENGQWVGLHVLMQSGPYSTTDAKYTGPGNPDFHPGNMDQNGLPIIEIVYIGNGEHEYRMGFGWTIVPPPVEATPPANVEKITETAAPASPARGRKKPE